MLDKLLEILFKKRNLRLRDRGIPLVSATLLALYFVFGEHCELYRLDMWLPFTVGITEDHHRFVLVQKCTYVHPEKAPVAHYLIIFKFTKSLSENNKNFGGLFNLIR